MLRVALVAVSILVSLACAVPASADPSTNCQRRKRTAVRAFVLRYLDCHAIGAPASCLENESTALSVAFNAIDETSNDCSTRGEMPAFASKARELLDLVAEIAVPDTVVSACGKGRVRATARLIAGMLTADTLRRKSEGTRIAKRVDAREQNFHQMLSKAEAGGDCTSDVDRNTLLWLGGRVGGSLASALADCQPVNGATLLALAEGVLSDRLMQAHELGYTEIVGADLCPGPGKLLAGSRILYADATLKSPATGDILVLRHSSPGASTLLFRIGPAANVTIFGAAGGIELSRDGTVRAAGADGRPIADQRERSTASVNQDAGGCTRMTDELGSCLASYCFLSPERCADRLVGCAVGPLFGLLSPIEYPGSLFELRKKILTNILTAAGADQMCRSATENLLELTGCENPAGDRCTPQPVRPCQGLQGTCDSQGSCIPDIDTAFAIGERCRPGDSSVDGGTFPLPYCSQPNSFRVDEAAYNGYCALDGQGRYPVCKVVETLCRSDQSCVVEDEHFRFPVAICGPAAKNPFAITGVAYRSSLGSHDETDARISYLGEPVFPVRWILQVESCPTGVDCLAGGGLVADEGTPIVVGDFLTCSVSVANAVTARFSLRLQDAEGSESPRREVVLTCAGGAASSRQSAGSHIGVVQ